MSDKKNTVLIGLLLLCVATASWACSCARWPARAYVCTGDYAIQVTIIWKSRPLSLRLTDKRRSPAIDGYLYDFTMVRVLKSTPAFDSADFRDIFISSQDNLCGKILEKGHTYVITGEIAYPPNLDGVVPILTTDVCNYIVDVNTEYIEERREVEELLNTTNFRCDEKRPNDGGTNGVARILGNMWGTRK